MIFRYPGFAIAHESGVDQVARFDASIEIFGGKKTVKVCIDTPFIKGLPTTMVVKECLEDGSYRESTVRRTYEDPFTLEFNEVYQWVTEGKIPKTTPSDARQDLGDPGNASESRCGIMTFDCSFAYLVVLAVQASLISN